MHRNTEQAAKHFQLLLCAEALIIGGNHRHPLGAMRERILRRELARRQGLAHPGWPAQRHHATGLQDRIIENPQARLQCAHRETPSFVIARVIAEILDQPATKGRDDAGAREITQ